MQTVKLILYIIFFIINQSFAFEQYTLDNGLKLFLKSDANNPIVLLQLWYQLNSEYNTDNYHYKIANSFIKNSEFPKLEALKKTIFLQGGDSNAEIAEDYILYSYNIFKPELKTVLSLEAQKMGEVNFANFKLNKWYHDWYAPNNAILVISGNIEITKTYKLVNRYFNNIKPSNNNPMLKIKTRKLATDNQNKLISKLQDFNYSQNILLEFNL